MGIEAYHVANQTNLKYNHQSGCLCFGFIPLIPFLPSLAVLMKTLKRRRMKIVKRKIWKG